LILDADGVFLSERPYWATALVAALDGVGLAVGSRDRWSALFEAAFDETGLQRVTKGVGCNSNWDLAAVLELALEDPAVRGSVAHRLESDDAHGAARELRTVAAALHDPARANGEPLAGFGIDRESARYLRVVERFQSVLHGELGRRCGLDHLQPRQSARATRERFEQWASAGWTLRVCTGRSSEEIGAAVERLGLREMLRAEAITSADDVERARRRTGRRGLAKPHWFPVACAAVGFESAVAALERSSRISAGSMVYAGDAWADYVAVGGARARGLDVRYVHVRSGVTGGAQELSIAETPWTIGVVSGLQALAARLDGVLR
jgi:phosphoglycolate phosphatase-like HAD superfamily hydrolase